MEKLDQEIQILSRAYSDIRRKQNKWKYKSFENEGNLININQDKYSVKDLEKRLKLKRNGKLLEKVYKMWRLLNPFNIAGISRVVFAHLLKFLYKSLYRIPLGEQMLETFVNSDVDIDSKSGVCMYFCNFHDSLFDILDSATNSKSITEYLAVINTLNRQIKDLEVLKTMNLHNKSHCAGKKAKYYIWMKEILKVQLKKSSQSKESNDKGMEIQQERGRVISLPRIKSSKNYNLEKISPLSIHKKSGIVKSYLLEEIIEGRNKYLRLYKEYIFN
ncbi:hypothetical protein SteCoe_7877 [Stentor coeruleus]|uniref:Uncharacterized protein n=1 Tax=Stentor coeruleus TaxID=5963 RepID=A0A1R2CLJ2_9CILI|nr:hypothetical protein SteCoe_7877 [Stentor coeruleus]